VSISVIVPGALTRYTRGIGTLVVDAPCATVADALAAIAARLPALTDRDNALANSGGIKQKQ